MVEVKVTELTKDYGHGRGIFDIDFEINKGEVLGFLGPNGAGKTTTIRHLIGYSNPDKGSATILGMDASKKQAEIMNHIGYLPGEVFLPEDMTGWGFIKMMKQMRHVKDDKHLNYLLKYFDVDPTGSLKRMSLGMKRKMAIVVAFIADPEILILDEPTSGLDPAMQESFISFMVEEKKRGKTILLSSHIFPEVEALCDRIAIIKEGKLVAREDARKLLKTDKRRYVIDFANKETAQKAAGALNGQNQGKQIRINVPEEKINNFFTELVHFNPKNVHEEKFDLESYFLDFYRSNKQFQTI